MRSTQADACTRRVSCEHRHMRTDPTDNGGLFVGRRPGTAPVRFRALPKRGSDARQRVDGSLANSMLAGMIGLSLLCWGPIPIACLWVGSQINYQTGSVGFGILAAFVALFVFLFGALSLLRRLDHAWILVRRAAGHDQRTGVHRPHVRHDSRDLRRRLRLLVRRDPRPRLVDGLWQRQGVGSRPWVCSTTTSSSRGCPRRRSTAACARKPKSAAAKRSRASTRSTSRRRPGRSCPTRASSTRSPSSRAAACTATRTCAAPSCATSSPRA